MNNTRRRVQTRTAIPDAATRCFAADGCDATGVAEICAKAGVGQGAFYYHFESKEAVFLKLIDTWLGNLENTLEVVVSRAETVPEGLFDMAGKIQPAQIGAG